MEPSTRRPSHTEPYSGPMNGSNKRCSALTNQGLPPFKVRYLDTSGPSMARRSTRPWERRHLLSTDWGLVNITRILLTSQHSAVIVLPPAKSEKTIRNGTEAGLVSGREIYDAKIDQRESKC